MAINKQITLNNGITYSYHRIAKLRLDITEDENNEVSRILRLNVLGYVSNEFRIADITNNVVSKDYAFMIDEAQSESNLRLIGYQLLKQLKEFENAVDC